MMFKKKPSSSAQLTQQVLQSAVNDYSHWQQQLTATWGNMTNQTGLNPANYGGYSPQYYTATTSTYSVPTAWGQATVSREPAPKKKPSEIHKDPSIYEALDTFLEAKRGQEGEK